MTPYASCSELFAEAGVGIIQMPCPQMEFDGGLERQHQQLLERHIDIWPQNFLNLLN